MYDSVGRMLSESRGRSLSQQGGQKVEPWTKRCHKAGLQHRSAWISYGKPDLRGGIYAGQWAKGLQTVFPDTLSWMSSDSNLCPQCGDWGIKARQGHLYSVTNKGQGTGDVQSQFVVHTSISTQKRVD